MEDFHWDGKSSLWACSDVNAAGFTVWPAPDFALLLAAPLLRVSYLEYLESPNTGPMFFYEIFTWDLVFRNLRVANNPAPENRQD